MPTTIIKGRRRYAKGRLGGLVRPMRFRRKVRSIYNPRPTFTETVDFGTFSMNGVSLYADQLTCTLGSLTQIGNYRALYNQARILRVQYTLMPAFTQYIPNTAGTTAPIQAVSAPRLVYAIQDTPNVAPPASELDVLTDNGSKIRLFTKPLKISHVPVPFLSETSTNTTPLLASVTKRYQWLNLNEASALTVTHGAINYTITQANPALANPQQNWAVYAKITFQLRDPK